MKLFLIALPPSPPMMVRHQWENFAAEIAGGYTRLGEVRGAWRDPNGAMIYEPMMQYQVATTHDQWRRLVALAFELFPNEQAIFWAEIGTATIETRDGH